MWNSLPDWTESAHNTNIFKNWITIGNIKTLYDFQAQIQGTGNRSEFFYVNQYLGQMMRGRYFTKLNR